MSSTWRIEVLPSAEKDLRSIPRPNRLRINASIDQLAADPLPRGHKVLQLERRMYRVRVGVYRVIYTLEVQTRTVLVVRAGHRRVAYRNLRALVQRL